MMRAMLRPYVHHMKWPMRLSAFVVHFLHQLAAFFAWIWMFVHVAGTIAQAGLQANRLREARIFDDIWAQGLSYFSSAGGGWQKILAVALVPAFLVAVRNAYATYDQFRGWVHEHKAAHGVVKPPSSDVPPSGNKGDRGYAGSQLSERDAPAPE